MSKSPVKPEATRPVFEQLPLTAINEPARPIRKAMDATKLEELAESMKAIGLLQPIAVVPDGKRYEIVAGHRRFVAACKLSWKLIPALVYPSRGFQRAAALMDENFMREDPSPAEEALFFAGLLEDKDMTEDQLCRIVRRNPTYVADRLRLLRGCPRVFGALQARSINFGVARELNKITDDPHRFSLLDVAVRGGATYAVVAGWVADWKASKNVTPMPPPATPPAATPMPEAVNPNKCVFCGGDQDPWNIVFVPMHKWERDAIMKLWQDAGKEQTA